MRKDINKISKNRFRKKDAKSMKTPSKYHPKKDVKMKKTPS